MSLGNGQAEVQGERFRREEQLLSLGPRVPFGSSGGLVSGDWRRRAERLRALLEDRPLHLSTFLLSDIEARIQLELREQEDARIRARQLGRKQRTPSEALLHVHHERSKGTRPSALLDVFDALVKRWGVEPPEARELLGFDREPALPISLTRRGILPLSRDARDRIRTMLEIEQSLDFRFEGDVEAEQQFLRRRHEHLGGIPLDRMVGGGLEGLLVVRDYLRWLDGL